MAEVVDFNTVSTAGLESSPVAARYFKNKYDQVFAVEPPSRAKETVDWAHRILREDGTIRGWFFVTKDEY